MERFDFEFRMYGRKIRIDKDDNVFVLRNEYYENPYWYKKKFHIESSCVADGTKDRGYVASVYAPMDRFNEHPNARIAKGDFPPRRISLSVLLAIKYISNGVDMARYGKYVIHKNGDNKDNTPSNLEWVDHRGVYEETVRKKNQMEIGSKIGLFTVVENTTTKAFHSQFGKEVNKAAVKVRCICGKELIKNPVTLKRVNTAMCCDECTKKYGKWTANEILRKHGLIKKVGTMANGHNKQAGIVMPPSYDLTPIKDELESSLTKGQPAT